LNKTYSVKIEGGDEITVNVQLDGSRIQSHVWNVVGSLDLLRSARDVRHQFPDTLSEITLPEGKTAAVLLLRELLAKIKGDWIAGDDDPEICHCRKVSQAHIERAIVLGAHTIEKIRKRTSANTGCGACMPDVEDLILKRIG
jgi:bacterioferritin-associated ferredoxin